jgi:hypothetical protein
MTSFPVSSADPNFIAILAFSMISGTILSIRSIATAFLIVEGFFRFFVEAIIALKLHIIFDLPVIEIHT